MRPSPSSLLAAALIATLGIDAAQAACFPQCRSGYVCQGSTCVPDKATPAPAPATRRPTPPPRPRLVQPPKIDPASPAPQPIDPVAARRLAEQRRREAAVRTDLKVGFIAAVGYSFNHLTALSQTLNPEDGPQPMTISGPGPGLVVGVGLRKNVVRLFGIQAGVRVHGYYWESEDAEPIRIGREYHDLTHTGFGLRVSGDLSLRVGPFADVFPMFLGVGGIVAADIIFGTLGFDGVTKTPDVSYIEVHFQGGGVAELGFIFGADEQYELGVRGEFMVAPDSGDDDLNSVGIFLNFAVAFP